ncbi:MAG: prepilin-type N-terminal cleavage/methylation domain-containing protein [Candidatus Falkowbacteria bacterium]
MKNKKAFTLIELLVVIAIIGILATISVLALSNARAKSRDAKRAGDMKQVQTALELFFNDKNRYPTTEEWNTGKIYSTTTGVTSTYMQAIPAAPTPADGACTNAKNTIGYTPSSDGASYSISFCLGNTTGTLTPGPKCLTPGGIVDVDCSPITVAPSSLSYVSPNILIVDTAISTLSPTITGSVDSYSISPALPTGLILDSSSGQITGTPTVSTSQTTHTVTATNIVGSTSFDMVVMVYGTVTGANSRIWLDRNLGATQVALSSNDSAAYGDLYQWGRVNDGHQLRTSVMSSGQVSNVAPGTNAFIIPSADWSSVDSSGAIRTANWGVSGSSNPCPTGFRPPTDSELDTERASWSLQNAAGAFASPLKLTVAGLRDASGSLSVVGSYGYYWSSVVSGVNSRYLYFFSGGVGSFNYYRARGLTIRCIKN